MGFLQDFSKRPLAMALVRVQDLGDLRWHLRVASFGGPPGSHRGLHA